MVCLSSRMKHRALGGLVRTYCSEPSCRCTPPLWENLLRIRGIGQSGCDYARDERLLISMQKRLRYMVVKYSSLSDRL